MDASGHGHTAAGASRGGFRAERASDGRYRWQLKAPNGRVVAITPAAYRTAAEAERGFDGLRAGADGLVARITHVRDGIGWIWVVPGSRGLPEVRSSRAYERYATCQNAFRRFVVLLAKHPALELPDPTGPLRVAETSRAPGASRSPEPLRAPDAAR
ncbi:DUF1508 domain-containing protein [Kitasatospora sp. NPDC056181]|uniref:DUF1508 domain-containing protein n=1 Tax=Kitasatospora sp. NPDC056181 TaxID=3345737 RepID=UPI0035E01AF7